MKRMVIIMLLAVTLTAAAQEKQINLGLIPTPQRVEVSQGGKSCDLDKGLPPHNRATQDNYQLRGVQRA